MPDINHEKMTPPYLRLVKVIPGLGEHRTMKWDLRISMANVLPTPWPTLHSLEHLFNVHFEHIGAPIPLVAPLGCGTGLYVMAHNIDAFDEMDQLVAEALTAFTPADAVPLADYLHCGMADLHDLGAAQRAARYLLDNRDGWANAGEVLPE